LFFLFLCSSWVGAVAIGYAETEFHYPALNYSANHELEDVAGRAGNYLLARQAPKSLNKAEYASGDHSKDPTTLVEFRLERTATGTLLVLTESGFDNIPGDFRLEAFRRNEGGWAEPMKNIERHVAKAA